MQAAAQRYCVSQQGLRSGRRAEERPQSLKRCVVINRKTTKFESNSQLSLKFLIVNKNYKAPNTTLGASLCKIKTSLTI